MAKRLLSMGVVLFINANRISTLWHHNEGEENRKTIPISLDEKKKKKEKKNKRWNSQAENLYRSGSHLIHGRWVEVEQIKLHYDNSIFPGGSGTVVNFAFLEVLKTWPVWIPSDPVWIQCGPHLEQKIELKTSQGLFQSEWLLVLTRLTQWHPTALPVSSSKTICPAVFQPHRTYLYMT